MKVTIMSAALACAATGALAGTLSIDWIGGPLTVEDYCCVAGGEVYTGGSWSWRFVFDVDGLSEPRFSYAGAFDFAGYPTYQPEVATRNPQDATLISRPDGHLGGFFRGRYDIEVTPEAVSLSASFQDSDDFLALSSGGMSYDHNWGMRFETGSGYWAATYVPDDLSDGLPFAVGPAMSGEVPTPSPVPLPATAPLLLTGLGVVGAFARRRRTTLA